ncbi:HAMP domain-containing sensor histidine kinase [Bradyrhizobium neotropicale]|uniref:sensor histidine kinase n=1 Tax=Bradyrhizobium neotropicale TaxID=1497615 RepID=UPI001AD743DB|nr:ATP-binding protein [Bradyrhizobium neotropicale]MBO4226829.1 two-component sensor histidine kinase [Bradyrhizobium neotropicale]
MNTLRARMAMTLILSIACVVGFSTLLIHYSLCAIGEKKFAEAVIDRVHMIAPSLARAEPESELRLSPMPGRGQVVQGASASLKAAFAQESISYDVVVSQQEGTSKPTVSINLGPGWLVFPGPAHGPPSVVWYAALAWMAIITIGTTAVALVAAHHITRKLSILERLATNLNARGAFEDIPEEGPDEVRATARALNKLGASLRAAVESRMRLVAGAGHDLRTPMTRMRLRAEFLPENDRAEWLSDLEEMDRIADSAIQLVREEISADARETIKIDEAVKRVCDDLSALKYAVEWVPSDTAKVSVAPLALVRALRNLIINAATHGEGARVRVDVVGSYCAIFIEDSGPGIPETLMASVFEPFFRVDRARRQHVPGAGLGLAIAKEIIERSAGKLQIENISPTGLRQIISLPVAKREAWFSQNCRASSVAGEREARPTAVAQVA